MFLATLFAQSIACFFTMKVGEQASENREETPTDRVLLSFHREEIRVNIREIA